MRSIMSALVVLVMMFAMVSASEAGFFNCCTENAAVVGQTHNSAADLSARDMDLSDNFVTGSPYSCIGSPAYTHYTDARAVPCPSDGMHRVAAPEPMGSPGL